MPSRAAPLDAKNLGRPRWIRWIRRSGVRSPIIEFNVQQAYSRGGTAIDGNRISLNLHRSMMCPPGVPRPDIADGPDHGRTPLHRGKPDVCRTGGTAFSPGHFAFGQSGLGNMPGNDPSPGIFPNPDWPNAK